MHPDAVRFGCPWSNELVSELADEEFRHEYMMDQVRSYIAFQIRALREQRQWNQADLAAASGKTQSVISRLEDPDYGKLSLQSCLEIAIAYDIPLLVQFVEWEDWLTRMSNVSPSALRKRSFDANRLFEINRRLSEAAKSSAMGDIKERPSLQGRNLGAAGASGAANANAEPMTTYNSVGHPLMGSAAAERMSA